MLKPLLAVVLVLVAAAAAAAPWEGVIESRMTRQDETQGSAGTGKT